eukprot:3543140-Pyramimonas_sp.AAC.1
MMRQRGKSIHVSVPSISESVVVTETVASSSVACGSEIHSLFTVTPGLYIDGERSADAPASAVM